MRKIESRHKLLTHNALRRYDTIVVFVGALLKLEIGFAVITLFIRVVNMLHHALKLEIGFTPASGEASERSS
ncbi:MAG TPA: hypothetical protein VH107_08975 [Lacipirellulaceae bacterium]|nr:hypothetical protein [Lacipirellulaceae bacterium]